MREEDEDLTRLRAYVEAAASSGIERLPPEPRLGDELGITRGRLRTMLKRLENEGLIWRHVGKGTFVGERQVKADDPDWSASISVDDIIDARLLLEPPLAARAAIHATPADVAAMEQCLTDMAVAGDFRNWRRLDEKLHRLIAEAAHNALLLRLHETLRAQVRTGLGRRMDEVFGAMKGPKAATDDEHRNLVAAIREHSPRKAQDMMRSHLESVRQHLFEMF